MKSVVGEGVAKFPDGLIEIGRKGASFERRSWPAISEFERQLSMEEKERMEATPGMGDTGGRFRRSWGREKGTRYRRTRELEGGKGAIDYFE